MFLNTKDDNLLLQIGALIHAILQQDPPQEIKDKLPIIYGGQQIEEHDGKPSMCRIKNQADLIDSFVDVLSMNPPHRNYTSRLFCRLTKILKPDFDLSKQQWLKLQQTLFGIIDLIQAHIKKHGYEVGLRFKDKLLAELGPKAEQYQGQPQDQEIKAFEFRRSISHHSVVTQ